MNTTIRKTVINAILFLVLFHTTLAAQAIQKGKTLEYNGAKPKTPLPHVGISVAEVAGPTTSEKNGEYLLHFLGLSLGWWWNRLPIEH